MKKDNETPTLEQLLASVEHAGRDARRQQQLAEMIERLAAEEAAARHRKVRLWSVRLIAAASLLLFMLTAVRLWYPSKPMASPQLAQTPQVQLPPITTEQPTQQRALAPAPQQVDEPSPYNTLSPMPSLPSQPVVEAPLLEETMPIEPISFEQYAEAVEEELPTTEESSLVDIPQPDPDAVAQADPVDAPETHSRQHGIFRLRQAESSLMNDNVLSFRII